VNPEHSSLAMPHTSCAPAQYRGMARNAFSFGVGRKDHPYNSLQHFPPWNRYALARGRPARPHSDCAPRSGDFSTARFYSYRGLAAAKDATVLARFDTGEPALVERVAGRGRVMVFASTLDLSWNDLALKPVFLPFVHQLGRHLSGFREQPAWLHVGEVLDVTSAEIAAGATVAGSGTAQGSRTVLSPSGQRRDLTAPQAAPGAPPPSLALELLEQGFYEIRVVGRDAGPGIVAASNVNLAESNLERMDPQELVAAVSGGGSSGPAGAQDVLPDEAQELAQRFWWYLLFAGILLLIAETVLAQRLSRAAR